MTEGLPKPTGLQLTSRDLHALGAVVAQWAIAESFIKRHISRLASLTPNPANQGLVVERSFSRAHDQWKMLLREVCPKVKEYLDIGLGLAVAARRLKTARDAIAHWPASRSGFRLDIPVQFVNVKVNIAARDKVEFTPEQIWDTSERICRLGWDVGRFDFALICDLYPQLVTWHGPKPEGPLLRQHDFTSLAA